MVKHIRVCVIHLSLYLQIPRSRWC